MSVGTGFWVEQYRQKAAAVDPLAQSGRGERCDLVAFLQMLRQMLDLLAVRRTDDVLNVGCANGLVDIVLSACCRSLLSIEPVEELAELARQNLADCPDANVLVARGDSIPCADACFDRVLVLEVIQLITPQDLRPMFAELCRVTRPGGRIVIGSVLDAGRRDAFLHPYLRGVREARHLTEHQKRAIIARNENAHWHDPSLLESWWRQLGSEPALRALPARDPLSDHRFHLVVDVPPAT